MAKIQSMNIMDSPSREVPPAIIGLLATLIGIGTSHHADLRKALRSRPIIPMLAVVITKRVRRLIGKRAQQLTKRTAGLLGMSTKRDGGVVSEERTSGSVAFTGASGAYPAPCPAQVPADGSFPKVIFQTWKSKVSVPAHFARWSESFRRLNPRYAYLLWDDVDNRNFIAKYYPWFLRIYDAYPREIYRADAVRYFFLYQFGGLYADMDTECLRPVDPLFESGDVWLGRMGSDRGFSQSIPNAIMASRPLQEFWLLAIQLLVEDAERLSGRAPSAGPETVTGPILLKRAYDTYMAEERSAVRRMVQRVASHLPDNLQPQAKTTRVELLEAHTWYPIDWSNIVHLRLAREAVDSPLCKLTMRRLFPKSFLVTYWTHSW